MTHARKDALTCLLFSSSFFLHLSHEGNLIGDGAEVVVPGANDNDGARDGVIELDDLPDEEEESEETEEQSEET